MEFTVKDGETPMEGIVTEVTIQWTDWNQTNQTVWAFIVNDKIEYESVIPN